MKVSPEQPFELIYSIYEHKYLGLLFESYVVQLNEKNRLSYLSQNISSKNACEFSDKLDARDFELIKLTDEIEQENISQTFHKKKIKANQFFLKTYDPKVGDKMLRDEIETYLERRRAKILSLIQGKRVFEMGKDGEPTRKELKLEANKASVLFHFRKNEDNTHYFPTIKLNDQKVDFLNNGSYLLCSEPAWMVSQGRLFTFEKSINGGKLKPFLKKKFILIPKEIEKKYYEKFIAPLVADFDVYAKGFDILTHKPKPTPELVLSEIHVGQSGNLFDSAGNRQHDAEKVLLELYFKYDKYTFHAGKLQSVSVSLEEAEGLYTFHRIKRNSDAEKAYLSSLKHSGLPIKNSRVVLSKTKAFDWLNRHRELLEDFSIRQNGVGKKYFIGKSSIDLQVVESIDWFDLKAVIKFGDIEIPFAELRNHILKGKSEIKLPNGEIGVIPDSWTEQYKDIFAFSSQNNDGIQLKKIYVALVKELKDGDLARVTINRKLEKLLSFDQIENYQIPAGFKGKLRPYQKAGYNWLRFLENYNFGGCLADDMGLGKTIQTLSLLQHIHNESPDTTSLLVMPTSLLYNWEVEAGKFTPKLRILNYTGVNRYKSSKVFSRYDLVLTSYGTTRMDTEILSGFYFNYIILDESQAIKNPGSLISQKVTELKSRRKLVLTGTPIENSTVDLWSQMNFLNPGLLGSAGYFKKEYQIPIEKQKNEYKTGKLNATIKPFLLRRDKSRVAADLPDKIISIRYCQMSEAQRGIYEREKNRYRNEIMDRMETEGLGKTQIFILRGLTQLRQIANHPKMTDDAYSGDSGKLEDITHMIENSIAKGHKVLIFSQFVKHLKIVADFLESRTISFAYLDGSTKDRQKEVTKFQEDSGVPVFLISLKAGGIGLNLTKAEYVFLLDPWWNPSVEAQAIDRAHRIGQVNNVFAYKFVTKDTIEEKIIRLQERKQQLASDLISVEESFVKSLSSEDIKNLFD